jgi:hypothetical protein
METTPEKFTNHLGNIAKTLDLGKVPSTVMLRMLGSLRK